MFESDDFIVQTEPALRNIVAVPAEADAEPHHVVRMTRHVTSKAEYLARPKGVGAAYRHVFGLHSPVMTAVEVSARIKDPAKVEIEATSVLQKLAGSIGNLLRECLTSPRVFAGCVAT